MLFIATSKIYFKTMGDNVPILLKYYTLLLQKKCLYFKVIINNKSAKFMYAFAYQVIVI